MVGRPRGHWLLGVGVTEAALLAGAAVASSGYDMQTAAPVNREYAMIALTAIAMGLRNATVRRLKVSDLTTTVVTFTLAGLAADSPLAGGNNPRPGRRVLSVIALVVGATVGALLLRYGMALPLFITAACVLGTSAAYASVAGSTDDK